MGVINRKVDPSRRMMRQHPYDVWRAFYALRMRDRLICCGDYDGEWYSVEDVARVLYINFDDLRESDQKRVIQQKLESSLCCLKSSVFIEEYKVARHVKDRDGFTVDCVMDGQGVYRARLNVFNLHGWSREMKLDSVRDDLDRKWGIILGRHGAIERYMRYR
jgi:hypothetical protein